MSELISGKEALVALSNGEYVEYFDDKLNEWVYMDMTHHFNRKFRLKPRILTINGIEVPAPFEPKEGDTVFVLDNSNQLGFSTFTYNSEFYHVNFGAWRTEDEIKRVLEVLRGVLNVK